MELVNLSMDAVYKKGNLGMDAVYKGTKEEFYEVYDLCHRLQLKLPGFYYNIVENEEWCYLEISISKIEDWDYYTVKEKKKEVSDRVKDYCSSYWVVDE